MIPLENMTRFSGSKLGLEWEFGPRLVKHFVNFQELNSIPTEISQSPHHLLSSSTVLASIPPSTSSKVSSQISAKNISNSTISENMLKILDSLCVDNCHMMLLASLLISVIFIISVFSIIILCRRKHNYNIKSRNGNVSIP